MKRTIKSSNCIFRMLWLGLILAVASSSALALAQQSERITFQMYEHVPMLMFQEGKAFGYVGERAYKVLANSGINFTVELSNPRRILATLKDEEPNFCTFGFFKTAERQKFVQYSKPFIQDIPQGLLIKKENRSLFKGYRTFVEALAEKNIVLGNVRGVSMGHDTDQLIEKYNPTMIFGDELEAIIRMLDAERFHYTLTDEIKATPAKSPLTEKFVPHPIKLPDVVSPGSDAKHS